MAGDRHLGAVRPHDLEWAEQAVMVPLDQLGLRRFAKLESLDTLHKLALSAMHNRVRPVLHFEVRSFGDLAQARSWARGGA